MLPHPVGEYAMSCLARERMFEYFSRPPAHRASFSGSTTRSRCATASSYDLARRVAAGDPIDVTMGYFNAIWQADANAMALASLTHATTPPLVVEHRRSGGAERPRPCEDFGGLLERPVSFTGHEADGRASEQWGTRMVAVRPSARRRTQSHRMDRRLGRTRRRYPR